MKVTKESFRKLNIYTIIAVYFLILVGGIVRTTGSGMGCPDWPKCFGSYIPPTAESQLPDGYQDHYLDLRLKKNNRIANMISSFGFNDLANKISNDPSILIEEPFNVTKTWIEYINRLIGVLIGLLITAVLVASMFRMKEKRSLFYWALASFVLVVFQGWFGSIVVSTNLLPGTISIHMLLALVLVCILLYMAFISRDTSSSTQYPKNTNYNLLRNLMLVAMALFLGQIFFGIQVREAIDVLSDQLINRNNWISNLGLSFYIHRSYSIIVFALQLFIAYRLFKMLEYHPGLSKILNCLVVLIILEIISGVVMAYFNVPAVIQPLHLLIASLIFGLQFYGYLVLNNLKKFNHQLI